MILLTALHAIVSRIRVRRTQTHGGAPAAGSDKGKDEAEDEPPAPVTSTPTWGAAAALQARAEFVSHTGDELPALLIDGDEIIMTRARGADWIRADAESVIDWREIE